MIVGDVSRAVNMIVNTGFLLLFGGFAGPLRQLSGHCGGAEWAVRSH